MNQPAAPPACGRHTSWMGRVAGSGVVWNLRSQVRGPTAAVMRRPR
ncbi:hypothetical protein RKD49_000091 [Streptomyces glaucescens]